MRMKSGIPSLAAAALLLASPALAQSMDWKCGPADKSVTPEQLFAARIEAMRRGDLNTVACTYQEDAVVLFPGQVVTGRDAIMQAFIEFSGQFGGALPTVLSTTASEDVLLVTYSLHTPTGSIPDGSDTFVLSKGRIAYQVVHATVTTAAQQTP